MENIRLGIAGLGNIGSLHLRNLKSGKLRGVELAAVCDANPERFDAAQDAQCFETSAEMIQSGLIDAILIATPHFDHTPTGILALQKGLHVLVEKPISVHKADAERLLTAHADSSQVFAAMFQMRTLGAFVKIKDLIDSGELSEIRRIQWTITDWFRPEAYYKSGGWRATWKGEGGGVTLNQCPHQLDLWQWLFGMPQKIRAFCGFGKYHNIEVEDDVTAYFEYEDGATGVFVTSTGEAPGTNRLEIAAEQGRLILEQDILHFKRNRSPMSEFSKSTTDPFGKPETWEIRVPFETGCEPYGDHAAVLQNFIDAIRNKAPLIAPAHEGIRSVELANAILLSAWKDQTCCLPMDAREYEVALAARAT